ncbi:carbohydate-binding domain-containing protein [Mucilaginibacter sp. Bleaf8]|nr:carbohydate-binding domain-containing protein [Mucilaginibacter sp. Bleaf8]
MMAACVSTNAQQKADTYDAKNLQVQWEWLQNNYQGKQQFKSMLTFTNNGQQALPAGGWKIYFNFPRQIVPQSVNGPVKIEHVNGDFFCLSPLTSFKGLKANESVKVDFLAGAWAVNFTDSPDGFYFVDDKRPEVQTVISQVKLVPPTKPEQLQRLATDKVPIATPELVYRQNEQIKDMPESSLPPIFPTPASYQKNGQAFSLTAHTQVTGDAAFAKETAYLKKELAAMFKASASGTATQTSTISLQKDADLPAEGYKLEISQNKITIQASTGAGAFYGIQSLKSLLPAKAWSGSLKAITVAGVSVTDQPRFGYRGLMLDVARNFHSKQQVLKVIDLMAYYKLNALHFHLVDDEGWRLEIPALPELTQVGSQRGHTQTNTDHLQPAYGSGPSVRNLYGSGYYTKADYVEILKYATERHVTVIPEIETPGHARAAIKSMDARYNRLLKAGQKAEAEKYLLRDLNDRSAYSSVQHWNDNVMDVSLPSTYNFISTVADEVVKMYREAGAPLQTIHFGGDEVPAGVWEKSPSVQKLYASNANIKNADDLWVYYYTNVNRILKERNLYVSAWEEAGMKKVAEGATKKQVPNPDFARENMHLYVWNNVIGWGAEDLAYRLANNGFPVILSCVSNLYFDLAYQKDYLEPGFYWGGFLDVDKPFKFIPYNYLKNANENVLGSVMPASALNKKEALTEQGKTNIVGIQAQLWSETARGPARMEYMLLPKLLGLAERAWAPDPEWASQTDSAQSNAFYQASWAQFCNVMGKKELPKLSYMNKGYQYRIPTAGVVVDGGMVKANVQLPGFTIRYTTDGSEPTATSPVYHEPLKTNGVLNFKVFNTAGRGGRTVTVNNGNTL